MAKTDTKVNSLVINKLTRAQYEAIEEPSETELYLVPDEIDDTPTQGSDNPVKSGGVRAELDGKQDSIADLEEIRSGAAMGATALQSFTESDPTVPSWAKQSTKPSYSYSEITEKPTLATVATSGSYNDLSDKPTIPELPSNTAYLSNDSGDGIVPDDGIRAVTVTSAAAMTISPDVVTVIDGAVGTAAITLQVPQDNLAHVWDILMTTDSSVAITFAMSNSETILYPSGFSVGASKAVEVSVIGVGETYYLRYGEFA